MAEVKSIQCTCIYLYEPDEFILQNLYSPGVINGLQNEFGLSPAAPLTIPRINLSSVMFAGGSYNYEGKAYSIESINIEHRKIAIIGQCPTRILEKFYSDFLEIISTHDPRSNPPNFISIINTFETIAVCKMTHPITSLFKDGVVSQIPEAVHSIINNHGSTVIVEPFSVKYRIKYRDVPKNIIENKIQLVEKTLTFEVRDRSSITDRLIFTTSPCDYDTHMKLVEIVEGLS